MKRLLYILFFSTLLISLPISAQLDEERHNFSIGINAGINLNTTSFTPKIKQNTQYGMSGGITLRYISEKYFGMFCGVQMELNYSQRGWNEKIEDGTENTYDRTMNYIEVPLLAHLAFGKDAYKGTLFFVNAGPQFGYFLSESEHMSDNWDTSYRSSQQYGKTVETKLDYGITAGGGLELNTKVGHFIIEGRYYLGLGDFYKTTKKDYFSRAAHTFIGIRAAYLFDISK